MRLFILTFLFHVILVTLCSCQVTVASKIPPPFVLDKSTLSGVGLQKIDHKNEPEKVFHQKRLVRGNELSVFVVSTQSWVNKINDYSFDEYIYMLHGESITRPENGEGQTFYTGQHFFAPKGYNGEWEIKAGDNLHYELSVITTHRKESKSESVKDYKLIDPSTLSGVDISFEKSNHFKEILVAGEELTITLYAEKPEQRKITDPYKESLLYIQSGQLTIIPKGETTPIIFYTGDFVFIPQGYTGDWKSEGLSMLKYLAITAS